MIRLVALEPGRALGESIRDCQARIHTVPTGRIIPRFQAFHARLPSLSPFGTKTYHFLHDSLAQRSDRIDGSRATRWQVAGNECDAG